MITYYVAPMPWWRKLLNCLGLFVPDGSKYRPFSTIEHAVKVAHSYDFEQEIPVTIVLENGSLNYTQIPKK